MQAMQEAPFPCPESNAPRTATTIRPGRLFEAAAPRRRSANPIPVAHLRKRKAKSPTSRKHFDVRGREMGIED